MSWNIVMNCILVSLSLIQQMCIKAFDFAGRTKLPRGPHAARGPRVGKPWSRWCYSTQLMKASSGVDGVMIRLHSMVLSVELSKGTIYIVCSLIHSSIIKHLITLTIFSNWDNLVPVSIFKMFFMVCHVTSMTKI